MSTLTFTPEMLARFIKATDDADTASQDAFTFEGHTFYVPYARYLIEHLTNQFNASPREH